MSRQSLCVHVHVHVHAHILIHIYPCYYLLSLCNVCFRSHIHVTSLVLVPLSLPPLFPFLFLRKHRHRSPHNLRRLLMLMVYLDNRNCHRI